MQACWLHLPLPPSSLLCTVQPSGGQNPRCSPAAGSLALKTERVPRCEGPCGLWPQEELTVVPAISWPGNRALHHTALENSAPQTP